MGATHHWPGMNFLSQTNALDLYCAAHSAGRAHWDVQSACEMPEVSNVPNKRLPVPNAATSVNTLKPSLDHHACQLASSRFASRLQSRCKSSQRDNQDGKR
jgi:hypothetical protein